MFDPETDNFFRNPNLERPQDTPRARQITLSPAVGHIAYLRDVPYTGTESRIPAPMIDRSTMAEFDNRPA